jgi:hypothetical protein
MASLYRPSAPKRASKNYYDISLDFDGVLCNTLSPWEGSHVIPDGPVEGALEFLRALLRSGKKACIFSCRNWDTDAPEGHEQRGIDAMKAWLEEQGLERSLVRKLGFPLNKPIARVYLDDRAYRFEGVFPTEDQLLAADTPWNKTARRRT